MREIQIRPFVLRQAGAERLRTHFREIGFKPDGVEAGIPVIGWEEPHIRRFFNLGPEASPEDQVELLYPFWAPRLEEPNHEDARTLN